MNKRGVELNQSSLFVDGSGLNDRDGVAAEALARDV
jgi:hypothetical protein